MFVSDSWKLRIVSLISLENIQFQFVSFMQRNMKLYKMQPKRYSSIKGV